MQKLRLVAVRLKQIWRRLRTQDDAYTDNPFYAQYLKAAEWDTCRSG